MPEEDDLEAELITTLRENKAALADHALKQEWPLDVQMETCENCEETHIEDAWWWGHGYVYADFDGFVVSFDPDPDDIEVELMAWECGDLEEALFLVEIVGDQYPAVDMPVEEAE